MREANGTVPDYPFVLPFEANFDPVGTYDWLTKTFNVSIVASVAYVMVLWLGQFAMKYRSAMDLKNVLMVWNAGLALFSTLVCVRQLQELVHVLAHLGWKHSVCSFSFYEDSPVSALWTYLFILSKLVELFDSLFLVLRKKKVIFLHWFHHSSVLVFSWLLVKEKAGVGRWYMSMNALVHSLMYSYYALSAMGLRIPRTVSIWITTMQVLQMILGLLVGLQAFSYWLGGHECRITGTAAVSSVLIYAAYLLLFLNFFAKTYIVPKTKKSS